MCHPLITAFQVLVKFCASVGKRVLLWISETHLQQLAHQRHVQFDLSIFVYLHAHGRSTVSAHENCPPSY